MSQYSFASFVVERQFAEIYKRKSLLKRLDEAIDWEAFHPLIEAARPQSSSKGGRRPYDAVSTSKILILKTLYNLSDDGAELQIRNPLVFLASLRLDLGGKVPDAKMFFPTRRIPAKLLRRS
ncbi:MAG: transposase [Planctomycetaceae bacterium]|jgi:hypothetical protein|nr:transposase [Planctomycetaceae bacterium]